MSHASIIILSETADIEDLATALSFIPEGERLMIVPAHLQPHTDDEPTLNINQPDQALQLQLIDNAIAALRPSTIIADIASVELITPNLKRYPKLQTAHIIYHRESTKKRRLKDQAAYFNSCELIEI